MNKLTNAILFQACWFSAIMVSWQLALLPFALLLAHCLVVEKQSHPYAKLAFLACLGLLLDRLWFHLGWFRMPEPFRPDLVGMPIWLVMMWSAFVLTLNSSLAWYQRYPSVFVIVCAVAGPLSYFAGQRLGVINITSMGFVALTLQWALIAFWVTKFLTDSGQIDPGKPRESANANSAPRSLMGTMP